MLGTLFGLIVLIYFLVLRFDPEARRRREPAIGPIQQRALEPERSQ